MYQTFARVLGTIIATKLLAYLNAHGYLPKGYVIPPDVIEYVGYGVLFILMSGWAALEKWRKGFFTFSPFKPANIPSLNTSVKDLNTTASVIALTPATPESKIP